MTGDRTGADLSLRLTGAGAGIRLAVASAGIALTACSLGAMGIQAVRSNATVNVQRQSRTEHDAALDNAYYQCIDTQARSLVTPGEPVALADDIANLITLLKGVGSWITVADPASQAQATLYLSNGVKGPGACLGTVVHALYRHPIDGRVIGTGTGASVPGTGPPPAPPL